MTRAFILTALVLSALAQAARAQVSTEEAYRRLRERQEEARRAAASQPATKPANPSGRSDASTVRGTKTAPGGGAMVDFEDAKLGIRLKYPATWKQMPPMGKANHVAFVDNNTPAKTWHSDSFTLQVQPFPGNESVEAIEKKLTDLLARETHDFKVVSDDSIQIAGHPGRKLVYLGHPGSINDPRQRQSVQAVTLFQGNIYTFVYDTIPEQYAKAEPTISAILNSIEVMGPADPSTKPASGEAASAAEKKPAAGAMTSLADYADPRLGFSIKRPAKWLHPKVNPDYVVVFLESAQMTRIVRSFGPGAPPPPPPPPPAPHFSASLNIVVQPIAAGKTLDAATESNKGMIHEAVNPFEMVSEEKIELGGQPARKLIYTGHDVNSKMEVKTVEAIVIANGRQYTITYITLPDRYPKESAMIDSILGSLQFTSEKK